ncbi:MAG: hypothetical protein JSW50_16420 [Candidatus Latescibacterota bacterium]|nr:MAG: hypothetical protein JSW50_16420 [Candidatus Latescibacterota bacterium]
MREFFWPITISVVLWFALAGCGGSSGIKPGATPPECDLVRATSGVADSVTVVSFDAIEPEIAPWARHPGERLLFHHLYETLINVDCDGQVRARLATSWRHDGSGRHWIFEMRNKARFWDGSRLTAHDVVKSWGELAVAPDIINAVVDSVTAEDKRILHVYLGRPQQDVPYALSTLEFAVVKSADDSSWPLGSGPYQIVRVGKRSNAAPQREIIIRPAKGPESPVVRIIEATANDARDLLEGAADLMITRDPTVLSYATNQPHLTLAPLPWNQTYVLLSTSRARILREGGTLQPVSPALSNGLARDAVRTDARPYSLPGWWVEPRECFDYLPVPDGDMTRAGAETDERSPHRIVYDVGDPTAKELAERIVALSDAAAGSAMSAETQAVFAALPGLQAEDSPGMITAGLLSDGFEASFRSGDDFAYIIAMPRRAPDPCAEIRKLLTRAPWLAILGSDFPGALIPLTDTREHAIANGNHINLGVDWYGNVFIEPAP